MNTHRLSRLLIGVATALVSYAAPAFDIYQLPMFATGAVTPNVMLLVDNSGSMNQVIFADAYDIRTTYPNQGFTPPPGGANYITLSGYYSCGTGGRRVSGTRKTMCLPAPEGGSTRYDRNYLNYLFGHEDYADGADLTGGVIPDKTRMQVARAVATDIVNTVTGLRFGLATFNGGCNTNAHGATILRSCADSSSSHLANLTSDIAGLDSENNTPLAEALYEITRYFRGLRASYRCSDSLTFTSPLQYRCQKNFTIAITDGFPTYDNTFPSSGDPDVAGSTGTWPDWDDQHPPTVSSTYPIFPQYSDGFKPSGAAADEGYSLYLDDIAKFGFDIDMKTSSSVPSTDLDGVSWDDPEFPKQNMTTYTVGFATANQMLQDAAAYSNGQYFTANNAGQLKAALEDVLLDIQSKATTAASVSLNSTRLDTNLALYQASFESSDWSGNLKAIDVDDDTGAVGSVLWEARDLMPAPTDRKIFTTKSDTRTGTTFKWDTAGDSNRLSAAQKNALKGTDSNSKGMDRLNYLRGVRGQEQQSGGALRNRTYVLGDIVNSDPLFVGTPNYGYNTLPGTEGTAYTTFRAGSAYASRAPVVYVGANDGMLHAFNANKTGTGAGSELFAYVPLPAYQYMRKITEPNYSHRFFVDGPPVAGDAYIGGAWKTVVVGALGAGGRGVFALDVTNPATFGASNVLWEKVNIDDPTSVSNWSPRMNIQDPGFADLGFTYGQASIARMKNGKWAAVVGNGYNSTNNLAVLYILDLADGSVMAKINTGVGSTAVPNGLSTPVIVDENNDKITDYIYAGDMRGNLWKFDVTNSDAGLWDVAYKSGSTNVPLFTATAPDSTAQPITAKPTVTRRPDGDLMVFFGTGKFFEEVDRRVVTSPTPQVQTFYGVRDPGAPITTGRSTLAQQSVITAVNEFGFDLRVTTAVEPTPTQNGWYLDLPTAGERQVSRPILRTGRIIFTTVIPNSDACHAGGDSWLMELDALSGSRLAFTPFDLTGEGDFDAADYVTAPIDGHDVDIPASGKKSTEGVIKTPGIAQKGNKEYKYTSGSSGGIEVTIEPGDLGAGRQSWRQLQ